MNFGKISNSNLKRRCFEYIYKKREIRRRVVWSLFIVFPVNVARVAVLQMHLMPCMSSKIDSTCIKILVSASPRTQILTGDKGSHHEVFPLPSADFHPLQPFLLPPIADSGHHHLNRRLLSHRPNHLITLETPMPSNSLLSASPFSSSSWLLHVEFIFACSD